MLLQEASRPSLVECLSVFKKILFSDWSTQLEWGYISLLQDGATGVICVRHCTMQQRRQQDLL